MPKVEKETADKNEGKQHCNMAKPVANPVSHIDITSQVNCLQDWAQEKYDTAKGKERRQDFWWWFFVSK
jgi:hypothetical protein